MIKIMKSESGNIALAMLLVVIGMMSGLSISSMSLRDTIAAQAEYDSIQGLHVLRAEVFRAQAFLETATKENPSLGGGLRTPMREMALSSSHQKKTFNMQSHMYRRKSEQEGYNVDGETGGTGVSSDEYLIRSLVQSKMGVGQVAYFSKNDSMVRKYSEMIVIQKTSPVWMYFTDVELDPSGIAVRFDGRDFFDGPVHSNDDIWIRQTSGANQGWPQFNGLVTTSGVIKVYPDGGHTFPEETIFRGGLLENYDHYEFPSTMEDVRNNGALVGPPSFSEDHIVFVEVNGSAYNCMLGVIQPARRTYADVWAQYPYQPYVNDVPPLYRNNFTVRDTIWTSMGGSSCGNRSNFVNSKLWIRGARTNTGTFASFASRQTWGAADTLFILGDILIAGTTPPDDPATNRTSMVGLISEESVVLKYGFWNPMDTLREHTNMGSDSEYTDPAGGGVWIYAAIAALGDGNGNGYEDGVFTFEYQHPHGSIPATVINVPGIGDTLFEWIDLHRNKWPQTGMNPWPPLLDLPWYNPLWPERNPYLMRGTINIWGGVNQNRRGFVRRNYVNDPNNNPNGIWNPAIDFGGGSAAPNPIQVQLWADPNIFVTLQTRNYPGATSSNQVGYRKNYRYDNRMYAQRPPDWPNFKKQGDRLPMTQGNWLLKRPPRSLV